MKIELAQVFYGRGERGYGVLGTSQEGQRFAARVEALCGSVGTPDGGYGGEPFLLSVPEGDRVVMVCGRRGAPDSIGRGTLFFHALVARGADLATVGTDAFSLFAQGAFAERMPESGVENLQLDVQVDGKCPQNSAAAFPAAIRSERPEPDAVRFLAGDRANTLRWTTCAFQPMPGFDLQVLPSRTTLPPGTNEYDAEGRLVRAAAGTGSGTRPARTSPPIQPDAEKRDGFPPTGTNLRPAGTGDGTLLKLSLLGNAVLAVVCAFLWLASSGKDGTKGGAERYRAELAAGFPQTARIGDFGKEANVLPKYEDIQKYPDNYAEAKKLLARLQAYVDFVNNRILDNPQRKDIHP